MALYRWNTSFNVRPHAVCTARALFAVTGPSMKLHFGPPRLRSRRRSKVPPRSQRSRMSSSRAGWSGFGGSLVKMSGTARILSAGTPYPGLAAGRPGCYLPPNLDHGDQDTPIQEGDPGADRKSVV